MSKHNKDAQKDYSGDASEAGGGGAGAKASTLQAGEYTTRSTDAPESAQLSTMTQAPAAAQQKTPNVTILPNGQARVETASGVEVYESVGLAIAAFEQRAQPAATDPGQLKAEAASEVVEQLKQYTQEAQAQQQQ